MSTSKTFPFVAKHLSLHFINTEVIRHDKRIELLHDKQAVLDWLEALEKEGYIHKKQFETNWKGFTEADLSKLKSFRQFLRNTFEAFAAQQVPNNSWIQQLEKQIEMSPFTFKIKDNQLWRMSQGEIVEALMAHISFDALQLYTNGQLSHLHYCANPKCILLFLDTSGRRKWCSMKICGNRMKVTKHQNKQQK